MRITPPKIKIPHIFIITRNQITIPNKINSPADMIFKYKTKDNFKLPEESLAQKDAI